MTEHGGIGMNVGGYVIAMPIREWHNMAEKAIPPLPEFDQPAPSPAGAIDPDNLLQFRKRLNVAGEFLCGLTDDAEAREAYAAVLYVQSSLLLDANELKLAQEGEYLERQWIVDLIRNEYDKAPAHYAKGDNWDDGAERIAIAILARLRSASPLSKETQALIDEAKHWLSNHDDHHAQGGATLVGELLVQLRSGDGHQ